MDRAAAFEKVVSIIKPFVKNLEALKGSTDATRIIEDLGVNSARLVDIILAFEEDGKPFQKAAVDPVSGRINGHGPLRVITPQNPPAGPDLSQRADPACAAKVPPERRFHEEYDHNGGRSPFAIVAVRVKPLPAGSRDVDWASMRDQLQAKDEIVFFGAIKGAGAASR